MKAIVLNVTSACNAHCTMCIREYDENRKLEHLPIEIIKKHYQQMWKLEYRTFSISGGEPCLYKHFHELIEFCKEKHFKYNLVTNGLLPEEYDFAIDNKMEYIAVSIDGTDENTHNRGINSFQKAISSIERYKRNGAIVIMICVLTQKNKHLIEDLVRLGGQKKIDEVRFASTIPTPSNMDLTLSENEKSQCLSEILRLRNIYKTNIQWCSSLRAIENSVDFCYAMNFLSALSINPRGELVFCCDTIKNGAVLGSLKESSFVELYEVALMEQARLKWIRSKAIINSSTMEDGFNSCEFCNKYLKKRIDND